MCLVIIAERDGSTTVSVGIYISTPITYRRNADPKHGSGNSGG